MTENMPATRAFSMVLRAQRGSKDKSSREDGERQFLCCFWDSRFNGACQRVTSKGDTVRISSNRVAAQIVKPFFATGCIQMNAVGGKL